MTDHQLPSPDILRASLGLTAVEAARLFGVHINTWHQWESGKRKPPAVAYFAFRAAHYLDTRGQLEDFRAFLRLYADLECCCRECRDVELPTDV